MEVNPLVFLLGGLALLVSTLTIAVLNRRAMHTENPYDVPQRNLDLSFALSRIRHADALYRAGLEVGEKFPEPTPERVADSLMRAGLGRWRVTGLAKRVEFKVTDGPSAGAPQVGEPLCHFTLGVLRGAFRDVREYGRVVEESCHGTGGACCMFSMEVKPVARVRQ